MKVENNLRKTGLEVVGSVPWGTHFCQFYQTKKDLLDVLIPYFKAGLESNELCVWVTSEFLNTKEALDAMHSQIPGFSKYLKKGQIEIFPHTEWYLKGGVFEMQRVLKDWVKKHDMALKKGFSGARVSGNPFWIDSKKDWNDFASYEAQINTVIDKYKLVVLCTYSLIKCASNEVIDVVSNHEFALIKRRGRWENIESAVHKRIEASLHQSKQRFSSFIDVTGQLGWTTNEAGEVVEDILSWRQFTGQSIDEIKGWGWSKALHPADLEHTVKVWKKAVKLKTNYEAEYRIKRFDGVYKYFLARGIPVMGKNKTIKEWVGTCIDITNLKELDLRKDEFISIASHELKTPLSSIKVYGQLIQKLLRGKYSSDDLLELTDRMNKQVNILQDYIHELLDVNKIQVGKLVLKKQKFDIYDLIEEECISLQGTLPNHQLKTYPMHQNIAADKERLRQVLINLITNAAKYSPNAKKIVIRCEVKEDRLFISVQDFGIGISKDEQDKIFDRFFQVRGLNRNRFEGLGLGLFISKGIVERLGGEIWVESKKDQGSTFFFTLPLGKNIKGLYA